MTNVGPGKAELLTQGLKWQILSPSAGKEEDVLENMLNLSRVPSTSASLQLRSPDTQLHSIETKKLSTRSRP